MGLDIRKPIGLLFLILGLQLAGFGLISDASLYGKSLNVNVNLLWGLVLLAAGFLFLLYSRRKEQPPK